MNSVEKVKAELKKQKIPVSKMERELGFANGYIGQLKKGSIPLGRLQQIADFLGKPLGNFIPDSAIISVEDMTEEQLRKLERQQQWIEQQKQEAEDAKNEYQRETDELIEALQMLRDLPERRALLHATRDLTADQVRQMADFLEGMKKQSENDS